jgi:hypothetical protein
VSGIIAVLPDTYMGREAAVRERESNWTAEKDGKPG